MKEKGLHIKIKNPEGFDLTIVLDRCPIVYFDSTLRERKVVRPQNLH